MGLRGVAILLIPFICFTAVAARAQLPPPSEQLVLSGKSASTWTDGRSEVVLLHGPVRITLDQAILTADNAVVWLAPTNQENLNLQDAQFALLGHAAIQQPGVRMTRSGEQLFVMGQVRGEKIRIVAGERVARDDSQTVLFKTASELRAAQPATIPVGPANPNTTLPANTTNPAHPLTRPVPAKPIDVPVVFEADSVETVNGDDGNVVWVLKGGVRLMQKRPNGEMVELSAKNAALFTSVKSLREVQQKNGKKKGENLFTGAYLENDVRIDFVGIRKGQPEQRLTADRVFYEFGTDRAVLTDAIVHTANPSNGLPVVMRANLIRQLSQSEFSADGARLSNSTFALPSYCIGAEKIYVRVTPTGDPRVGDVITFDANNLTMQAFGQPFFYMPHAAGDMGKGFPLRALSSGHDAFFGNNITTTWGLFETLGKLPPAGLDVNFRADFFGIRGPATGLNAKYDGGFVTDTTRQPWDFDGQFKSYVVYDKGADNVGRPPIRVDEPVSFRGDVLWEHQHFFPDGWQAQARIGYVSDATFLEQWFRPDFETDSPRDMMLYLKHQHDSEAFTFGANIQPSKLVTTSDFQQEQFEVENLPTMRYDREGDALLGDRATLFSENQAGGLHFARSKTSLLNQGFYPPVVSPGIPAEGYTGLTGKVVWRGDFREELDWPFTLGPLRIDPYVMGRYTQYSDSPQGHERSRVLAGAGTRITTEFWKVDPSAESELFDIHQLRHVVEPEVNFFTSAMNVQRGDVFVYDQQTDAINDISGAQFAVHQQWETKRGGPGQWRSVDLFSLNVELNYFANKPSNKYLNPYAFRGLFFASYPEESVPRDSVNADASWRLSDNTVMLGDMSYNLDRGNLQTLSIGFLVRRDERLSYFVGNRYIADLNSNITSVHIDYQLTPKYTVDVDQEFDFTQGKNVYSSVALLRRFDTFLIALSYSYDETTRQTGFNFSLVPLGLGQGLDGNAFNTFRR